MEVFKNDMENRAEHSQEQELGSRIILGKKALMTNILDIIQRVLYWVIGLLVLVMIASNVLQVFYRYVLHASLRWPEEISIFTMMWVTLLGGAVLSRRGAHISIDFIMPRLSEKSKRTLLGIIFALCLGFYVPMVYYGYKFSALTWGYVSPSTKLSMGMLYSAIPVGFFLMIIFTLEAASVDLKKK
jgi:TRAP-type C4-dicarboxylate transport system permease small subunit